ncbi:sensor histidine kinase [Thermocatellispora tengchongensis]|uniref:sensor histidine kinase n=1 Tax=Thermocatellispora tengchongensis TaxID=1073253 RepID=UPI00362D4F36
MPPILAGSALIRLGLRTGLPILAAMMACQAVWTATMPPYGTVFAGFYYGLTVFITGFVLYAVTRLVVVTRELSEARAELAEAAVLRERLRISRDLHDGLGRSLTAIALKGDLAARLVETEPGRARAEVGELARVAREAAQDVRRVARGYREMSLEQEVHRAVALLEASGVECQVNLADAELPRPVEEVLAWAVREGVTNVLRHSAATTCSITTSAAAGGVRLEIVNNGASAAGDGTGSGLAGLAERAAAVAGRVEAGRAGPEGFRLAVEAAT